MTRIEYLSFHNDIDGSKQDIEYVMSTHAIEFAEWCEDEGWVKGNNVLWYLNMEETKTSEELHKIF